MFSFFFFCCVSYLIIIIIEKMKQDYFMIKFVLGNAIQTLKSADAVKLITVRGTAFEAAAEGGNGEIVKGECLCAA